VASVAFFDMKPRRLISYLGSSADRPMLLFQASPTSDTGIETILAAVPVALAVLGSLVEVIKFVVGRLRTPGEVPRESIPTRALRSEISARPGRPDRA
jgi:hypothetical protein